MPWKNAAFATAGVANSLNKPTCHRAENPVAPSLLWQTLLIGLAFAAITGFTLAPYQLDVQTLSEFPA